jgi:hypothetical protein
MRVRTKIMLVLLIAAGLLAIGLLFRHIRGPRVVARVETPDGFELCIVQQASLRELPWFKTSFLSRHRGGTWERFYFHHEDSYWGGSRVSLETNAHIATFYRGSAPAIAFAWTSGAYTNLHRFRRPEAPQQMPAGWSPQEPVP